MITEYFDIGDVPIDYCDQHFYEPEIIPEYIYDETEIPEPTIMPEDPNAGNGTEDPNAGGGTEDPNAGGGTEDPNAGGGTEDPNAGGGTEDPNAGGDGGGDWNENDWEVY